MSTCAVLTYSLLNTAAKLLIVVTSVIIDTIVSQRKTEAVEVVVEKIRSMTILPTQAEKKQVPETKPTSDPITGMCHNIIRRVWDVPKLHIIKPTC